MPHIRIRSLPENVVAELSKALPSTLAKAMATDEDNFTVERVETQFFRAGRKVDVDPMIEILWFDRGQSTKDECAKLVTKLVSEHSSSEYIAVVFTNLAKTDYYENGKHF